MSTRTVVFLIILFMTSAGLSANATLPPRQHVLIISGIGGEPYYSERFASWGQSFKEVLIETQGVPAAQIHWLRESDIGEPLLSTKENILGHIQKMALTMGPDDALAIVFFGHASARGSYAALNLPGPDLRAQQLSEALDQIDKQQVLVVLAAASSGAFLGSLSAPGRIVVTATANGSENQHAMFGQPFVKAFTEREADLNKDKRVSVLEAFWFAKNAVREHYKRERLVVVEHALLDDNGDGRGATDVDLGAETAIGDDGQLAARVFLDGQLLARQEGNSPEQLRSRLAARDLVQRIETLKREKEKHFVGDYESMLETLLVELALNRRAYRSRLSSNPKQVKP